jgi:uncharacterized protein (TIGR00252 family)
VLKILERFKARLGRLAGGRLCAPIPANTSGAGAEWERRALAYLQRRGLTLLAANFRCPGGEIDLIMRDGATMVFVEVRQRSSASHGGAAASDVVAVEGERIAWLVDAVQAPD